MRRWQHSSMKCAAFSALSENRMPLLARMPTGMPAQMREAGDERRAVERLELVELGGVDQPRDDLAHVVLLARVRRHDAVELGRGELRLARRQQRNVDGLLGVEIGDDAARERQRMRVVGRHVIGDAGFPRMHVGAAEILGRDHLAGRGLHQRRAAEEDGALPLHDDGLVAHRRHIGAAGGAGAHHHGDLRNAERGQASPDCRRCGRNARGRETPRSGAAGWRRRSRPDRCRAAGSRARSPGRADASSPSSDSRCRP